LHADPSGRDLSLAMRDAVAGIERELVARGEPFDEAVRRKRQDCGLPVPLPGRVLPLWPRRTAEETNALRTLAQDLERDLDLMGCDVVPGAEKEAGRQEAEWDGAEPAAPQPGDGSDLQPTPAGPHGRGITYATLRARSAELQMREAHAALEAAELAGATPTDMERLERAFLRATTAYDAARSLSLHVTVSTP
jgi:hypothetical protein